MSFETEGKIILIEDTVQVTDTFKKREFVIEKEETKGDMTFQDFLKFQSVQDRCAILDNFNVGDTVKVSFNIKGRKWEKENKVNYFTNLEAWRVEAGSSDTSSVEVQPSDALPTSSENGGDDDLPF